MGIIVSNGQFIYDKLIDDSLHVYNGGVVSGAIIESRAEAYVYSGASVTNVVVNASGFLQVGSGGIALKIIENGGSVHLDEGANVTFDPHTVSGITLQNGTAMTVHSNTVAEGTNVDGGALHVYKDGVVNSTTINNSGVMYLSGSAGSTIVNSGGALHVSTGGIGNSGVVNEGGVMYVYHTGTDNDTTVNSGGRIDVLMNGTANGTVMNESGVMNVYSGGTVNDAAVNFRGSLCISGGATANQIVENGGYVKVEDGANASFASNTISGFTLSQKISMTVHSNTIACDITAADYGKLYVCSGGIANNTSVEAHGILHISGGGIADSAAVQHRGSICIDGGGTATQIVEMGGEVIVKDGAYATFLPSTINDLLISSGCVTVHNNTVANNTTLNEGMIKVYDGGTINDTVVTSGNIYLSGGVASNTYLDLTCYLEIYDGGIHRGTLRLSDGGRVRIYNSGTVDFTVSERSVNDDYLIDNLANVYTYHDDGILTYTITVAENQIDGTYMLAQGAQYLEGSITVGDGTVNYGTVTANGEALEYNGATYELDLSDGGDLTLTITGSNTADPSANLLCNGVSQIVACDSSQGKVGYTATNGSVRPAWKGVWEWSGTDISQWSVEGVGRFQGSEVDYNGLLLYNKDSSRFAAWTDLKKDNYGYVELCHVDNSFETECLADLDGSEYDDILIHDDNGSIGVVLDGTSYKDIWHVEAGEFKTWTLEGAGSFDDGADKLVMVNNYNNQVYLWTNKDTTFSTWNWETESVGKLEDGWEIAAIGDFERDGIDDIMVLDRNTNNVWVWDDGNSQTKRWRGTLGEGFKIEAVGDYNGDGKEDLLLREHLTGWGGMGYWGAGYAGNWVDLNAHIETDLKSSFTIIA